MLATNPKRGTPPRSRTPAFALLLAGVAGLTACGPSTSRLSLELRDGATHAPIAGAGVEADSLALGFSLQLSDVLDQALGKRSSLTSRGLTGPDGRVSLEVIPNRSVRVLALVPGQPPAFGLLEQTSPGPWLSITTDPGAAPAEIRILPR